MSGRFRSLHLLTFSFLLLLLFSVSSKAQWVQVSNSTSGLPLFWTTGWAIDAVDSSNAVISISGSGLYRTTDGGGSWKNILKIVDAEIIDVSIADKNSIWTATSTGQIRCTIDGGTTWKIQLSDTSKTQFMNYIKMFALKNGIAMGDCNSPAGPAPFFSTTDGGEHWTYVNNEAFGGFSGDLWRRIDFPNKNTGYFMESGVNPQYIYKTANGGKNWTKLEPSAYVMVLKFYDDNIGLYYGGDARTPIVNRTKNGGLKWEQIPVTLSGWGNDIEFIPNEPAMVWFCDGTKLYFSTDTCSTFKEYKLTVPSGTQLLTRDIVFPDKHRGWLLCDNGLLYRTANFWYKTTGVRKDLQKPDQFSLMQNYPNPFNPSTTINYSITGAGNVKLTVYDLLGNEIKTLVDEYKPAGNYSVQFSAGSLPSGTYFYRIQCGSYSAVKKMTVLK